MRVCVVLEHRFHMTPDGAVWTDGQFASSFWSRYLDVFDRVRVIARVQQASDMSSGWKRADAQGVAFAAVPYYVGPTEYLRKARSVRRAIRDAVDDRDAVILRVSSHLSSILIPTLRQKKHPYAVEVVADPYDAFSPGGVKHPLRPLFRWLSTRNLRRHCVQACAAAYVTAQALQRRYPPGEATHATNYSSVELPSSALVQRPRVAHTVNGTPWTLVTVGTLEQLYKAPDVLLDAFTRCVRGGLDLRLVFIGDGKHRKELETRAAKEGLAGRVDFLGQLTTSETVRAALDQADLFVLPSRHEGLPRAMIEAMARALPCIGSTAGGIPELLRSEDMVSPGDAEALARKIREVVFDADRMARMSARNLDSAKAYRKELLTERRIEFYRYIKDKTNEWIEAKHRQPVAWSINHTCQSTN